MDCFGTYSKPVITFVFKVLRNGLFCCVLHMVDAGFRRQIHFMIYEVVVFSVSLG